MIIRGFISMSNRFNMVIHVKILIIVASMVQGDSGGEIILGSYIMEYLPEMSYSSTNTKQASTSGKTVRFGAKMKLHDLKTSLK